MVDFLYQSLKWYILLSTIINICLVNSLCRRVKFLEDRFLKLLIALSASLRKKEKENEDRL